MKLKCHLNFLICLKMSFNFIHAPDPGRVWEHELEHPTK